MFFIHCGMHSAYQRGHCYHCLPSESCISADIILPSMPVKYSNVPNAVERMPLLSRDISFFSDTMEGHRWTTLVAGSIFYVVFVRKPCCYSQLGNIAHSWEPTSYPQQTVYGTRVQFLMLFPLRPALLQLCSSLQTLKRNQWKIRNCTWLLYIASKCKGWRL